MHKSMTADLERLAQKARERGRAFRVLIVDDETWVRDVFRDFCNITNVFEIDLAGSGTEAIAKANQTVYDLITMDLIMPEMSGLDALIEIKQNSPQVPVMVVTGNATDRLVREAGIQGASRVLYKPIMLEEFIAEVATALA